MHQSSGKGLVIERSPVRFRLDAIFSVSFFLFFFLFLYLGSSLKRQKAKEYIHYLLSVIFKNAVFVTVTIVENFI